MSDPEPRPYSAQLVLPGDCPPLDLLRAEEHLTRKVTWEAHQDGYVLVSPDTYVDHSPDPWGRSVATVQFRAVGYRRSFVASLIEEHRRKPCPT